MLQELHFFPWSKYNRQKQMRKKKKKKKRVWGTRQRDGADDQYWDLFILSSSASLPDSINSEKVLF